MTSEMVDLIRTRGYWRINFRPERFTHQFNSAADCLRVVESCAVRIRGWEYPAILKGSRSVKELYADDGYAQEIRLGNFLEFWKLFRTGQFIHYAALAEDWFENTSQPVGPPPDMIQPNTRLSFEEAIYRVAEIYEFLARLVGAGLYEGSVGVRIELHNLKGREIWIQSRHRGHFPHPHTTAGSAVVLDERLEVGKVVANPSAFAAAHLQRIFRSFGFSPSLEQMNAEVERARSGRGL